MVLKEDYEKRIATLKLDRYQLLRSLRFLRNFTSLTSSEDRHIGIQIVGINDHYSNTLRTTEKWFIAATSKNGSSNSSNPIEEDIGETVAQIFEEAAAFGNPITLQRAEIGRAHV